MWCGALVGAAVDENSVLGPSGNDDDDVVDSVPVAARLVPPRHCSVGDGEGLWVMAEFSSELSLTVLLWPLLECCRASSGVELTAPP